MYRCKHCRCQGFFSSSHGSQVLDQSDRRILMGRFFFKRESYPSGLEKKITIFPLQRINMEITRALIAFLHQGGLFHSWKSRNTLTTYQTKKTRRTTGEKRWYASAFRKSNAARLVKALVRPHPMQGNPSVTLNTHIGCSGRDPPEKK